MSSQNAAGTLYARSDKLCSAAMFVQLAKGLACISLYDLRRSQSNITYL